MTPEQSSDKKSAMPPDTFMDDLLWVATETVSPTADPKHDPLPEEEAAKRQ